VLVLRSSGVRISSNIPRGVSSSSRSLPFLPRCAGIRRRTLVEGGGGGDDSLARLRFSARVGVGTTTSSGLIARAFPFAAADFAVGPRTRVLVEVTTGIIVSTSIGSSLSDPSDMARCFGALFLARPVLFLVFLLLRGGAGVSTSAAVTEREDEAIEGSRSVAGVCWVSCGWSGPRK
jgi:hypothetical protein